ncbi:MAG: hypothetical protein HWE26_14950 [Alteromonadaceae bacterium]|nr:hypothetical protein [Alteromonadaceae bacterium]
MRNNSDLERLPLSENEQGILDAAKMATFLRVAEGDEAKQLVTTLFEEVTDFEMEHGLRERRRRSEDSKSFEVALGAFLGDLLVSASHMDSGGYFYRHQNKDDLRQTKVSYTSFMSLADCFERLGYMQQHRGYGVRDKFEEHDTKSTFQHGKAGRYRATPKLLERAASFGLSPDAAKQQFPIDAKNRLSLVVCRSKSGLPVALKDAQRLLLVQQKEEEVARISAIYSQHDFAPIDQPRVLRIFNNADSPQFQLDQGGRLYVSSSDDWINNKEVRRGIRIDREPTVQVDISSCFIAILHGLLGFPFDPTKDYYSVDGLPRPVVKSYVTRRLGAGHRLKKWHSGAVKELSDGQGGSYAKQYKYADLHEPIEAALPILLAAEEGGINSLRLQYEEAEMMVATILELGEKHGVAALPVHDCIVVPQSKLEIAKIALERQFTTRFKLQPRLSVVYS